MHPNLTILNRKLNQCIWNGFGFMGVCIHSAPQCSNCFPSHETTHITIRQFGVTSQISVCKLIVSNKSSSGSFTFISLDWPQHNESLFRISHSWIVQKFSWNISILERKIRRPFALHTLDASLTDSCYRRTKLSRRNQCPLRTAKTCCTRNNGSDKRGGRQYIA